MGASSSCFGRPDHKNLNELTSREEEQGGPITGPGQRARVTVMAESDDSSTASTSEIDTKRETGGLQGRDSADQDLKSPWKHPSLTPAHDRDSNAVSPIISNRPKLQPLRTTSGLNTAVVYSQSQVEDVSPSKRKRGTPKDATIVPENHLHRPGHGTTTHRPTPTVTTTNTTTTLNNAENSTNHSNGRHNHGPSHHPQNNNNQNPTNTQNNHHPQPNNQHNNNNGSRTTNQHRDDGKSGNNGPGAHNNARHQQHSSLSSADLSSSINSTSSSSEDGTAKALAKAKEDGAEEKGSRKEHTGHVKRGTRKKEVVPPVQKTKGNQEQGNQEQGSGDVTVSDLDVDVVQLYGSKYRPEPRQPILLKREVFEQFKEAVASILHDEWRKPRLRADGTYEPRPKTVDGKVYDIANLPFPELPPKFQKENAEAAEVACTFVIQSVRELGRWEPEQLELGSKQEHDAWLDRNSAWAEPHQKLPYDQLSTEEKDKDRAIVLAAIDYLAKYYNHLIWADRVAGTSRPPPTIDVTKLHKPKAEPPADGSS